MVRQSAQMADSLGPGHTEAIIEGVRSVSGGVISSHNDHRIAMAFAILDIFLSFINSFD